MPLSPEQKAERHRERLPILAIRLPVELTNGNEGRGSGWQRKDRIRKSIEQILFDFRREPFEIPTSVVVTRIVGKGQRLWDSSSVLRGNWKEIEDALVVLGWWKDDSPKFITQTLGLQDATQRDNGPAVLVEVYDESRSTPVHLDRTPEKPETMKTADTPHGNPDKC